MGLINWIFDFYQQSRIERAADEATALRGELAALRTPHGGLDQGRLERAIGELALAAKTLQRLAVQKGVCTDDEFRAMARAIDLEDGVADGRAPIL